MKLKLTHKLIKAMIGNDQCIFSEDEKKYISQLEIGEMTNFEDKNFFYLLINVQNNLEKKSKENITSILSRLAFEFEEPSAIEKNRNSSELPKILNPKIIYDYLGKKNFILMASQNFGSATFFADYFIENYKERKGKWIICVPTELLEQQLILNLCEKHQELSEKIGNNIFKNDILILTPEKLLLVFNANIKINQIAVDQAHNLLSKNIDRMVFTQKQIANYIGQVEHIYFAAAFMSKQNQENFKEMFKKLELQCISISLDTDKKNLVFQENSDFSTSIESKKYHPEIREESDLPILIYENDKDKCIYLARKEYKTNENEPIINLPEIKDEFQRINKKFWYNYLPIILANYGISYLHSDMPINVQNFIIKLIKKKYIKKIFATNTILNGTNLTFKTFFSIPLKFLQKEMTPSDLGNHMGEKVSSLNDTKNSTKFVFTSIKNNQLFYENNFNDKARALENAEDDMIFFDAMSYPIYKEEKNEIYLFDPRVSPLTTKKIKENNFTELDNWKTLIFYRSRKNKKELQKFIKSLFDIYELQIYDKKFENKKIKRLDLVPIITATRNYCQANFNVQSALRNYKNSFFLKSKLHDSLKWTRSFEHSLFKIKKYGQYFFTMFLSHYISIKSQKKFIEYLSFGTFDDHLIEAIEKTQNKEKWILMVNETDKYNNKNTRRFNNKWKDCATVLKGYILPRKYEFTKEVIAYLKEQQYLK